ncbi:hypothetical protein IT407_04245 [Candidatus Uhrbacteria bacterium]|nr:hypothetical protein [Candidatus Uhrbacteria bacterium]
MDLLEKHLADANKPNQNQTNIPVQAVKNETAALEHEVALLKQRFKWITILWWILFVLLVIGAVTLIAMNMWDTWKLREESLTYGARVERRIDETAVNSQRNLQDRSATVEERLDRLMHDYANLKADMSTLQFKLEMTERMCSQSCNGETK